MPCGRKPPATRRDELLANAVQADPEFQSARWHSGQLKAGGEWLSIDQVQQAAAADPRRTDYLRRREANSDSLDGQLALARWCRKNGFGDEAQFHWRTVLSHEPKHEEALRALGVRWYGGRLMAIAEIESAKASLRESRSAAKRFAPQVAQWERLLVVGRTVRSPSATVNLSLGNEKVRTTLGHPFWVVGVGWRMAKELGDGAILHGVHGPVRIYAVEPADVVEAYNLIVADFNTYFVGEAGVLVHDNSPREPTTAIVPGLSAQ